MEGRPPTNFFYRYMISVAKLVGDCPRYPVGQGSLLTLLLETGVEESLETLARSTYPNECCGILGGHNDGSGQQIVRVAIPTENVAPAPLHSFAILPSHILQAECQLNSCGLDLVGFFHSHPGGSGAPSRADIAAASPWPSFIHCIVSLGALRPLALCWYVTGEEEWLPVNVQGLSS